MKQKMNSAGRQGNCFHRPKTHTRCYLIPSRCSYPQLQLPMCLCPQSSLTTFYLAYVAQLAKCLQNTLAKSNHLCQCTRLFLQLLPLLILLILLASGLSFRCLSSNNPRCHLLLPPKQLHPCVAGGAACLRELSHVTLPHKRCTEAQGILPGPYGSTHGQSAPVLYLPPRLDPLTAES